MTLSDKQCGVLKGMTAGVIATFAVLIAALVLRPVSIPPEAAAGERIAFALKVDAVLALFLAWSVGRLARHRFFAPDDIDGGGLAQGTHHARVLQSTLQNTLEQTVLAVLTHVIWSVAMPASWMSVVPAAAVLFVCGRVLFVRGYEGGAPSRALGFAITFYPSVLMLVLITVHLVFR